MKKIILFSLVIITHCIKGQNVVVPDSIQNEKSDKFDPLIKIKTLTSFSIISDQDILSGEYNEDMDYTMGVRLEWTGLKTNSKLLLLPWLHYYINKIPNLFLNSKYFEKTEFTMNKIGFGMSGFTPKDIGEKNVITNDRPYANLLFLTDDKSYRLLFKNKPIYINTSLTAGIMGGAVGKYAKLFQSAIHSGQLAIADNALDSSEVRPNPLGWENQIAPDGAFALQYDVNFGYSIVNVGFKEGNVEKIIPKYKLCVIPNIGGGVGTVHRYGKAGIEFKTGWYRKKVFGSSFNQTHFAKKGFNESIELKKPSWELTNFEFYLIAKVNARYWSYNALLQGPDFHKTGPHYVKSSDINNTMDYEFGAGITINNVEFSYSTMGRSAQTKLTDRTHKWGRVKLTFLLD